MTDLKSLKDTEFGRNEKEDREFLRQEAIKDIKAIKEAIKSPETIEIPLPFCSYGDKERIPEWRKHLMSITIYIMWKNNITEEDLK